MSEDSRTEIIEMLVDLVEPDALFHDSRSLAYVDLRVHGVRYTFHLGDGRVEQWLAAELYRRMKKAPGSAMRAALDILHGKALFEGVQREVHVRVAKTDGKFFLDLANARGEVAEIDGDGWRIVIDPVPRFIRTQSMGSLPRPEHGGSLDALRTIFNLRNEQQILIEAWLIASLRPQGPYPVLAISGEQGTGKSSRSKLLRMLVDPNEAPIRALPRTADDFYISAAATHVQAFDNVSGLPLWLSDAFCRVATGAGHAKRQLYRNRDEVVLCATRPILLNGIDDVVTRHDLADRSIFVEFEPIPEKRRRSEEELGAAFEAIRAGTLGALLDAVSHGIRDLPKVELPSLPRMADFFRFANACEATLWHPGGFSTAYQANRNLVADVTVASDPIAAALVDFMTSHQEWRGTGTALLRTLKDHCAHIGWRPPRAANALGAGLRRVSSDLRKVGIAIDFERDSGPSRTRMVVIRRIVPNGSPSSGSSMA